MLDIHPHLTESGSSSSVIVSRSAFDSDCTLLSKFFKHFVVFDEHLSKV